MDNVKVIEGLKEVLSNLRPDADLSNVSMETRLVEDLAIDSLSLLLLSLATENKFGVEFPNNLSIKTVADVVNAVNAAAK